MNEKEIIVELAGAIAEARREYRRAAATLSERSRALDESRLAVGALRIANEKLRKKDGEPGEDFYKREVEARDIVIGDREHTINHLRKENADLRAKLAAMEDEGETRL